MRNEGTALPALVFQSIGLTEAAWTLIRHSPGFLTGFGLQAARNGSRARRLQADGTSTLETPCNGSFELQLSTGQEPPVTA